MIKKNDCLLLLTELQEKGEDVDAQIKELVSSSDIPLSVVKYLNDRRQFDVASFYEQIRYNYNHKSSTLYRNLVREQFDNPEEALTTLASLSLQILLYAKKSSNRQLFIQHSRLEEITRVLNEYTKTWDLMPCLKLLYLVKSDLKLFETLKHE